MCLCHISWLGHDKVLIVELDFGMDCSMDLLLDISGHIYVKSVCAMWECYSIRHLHNLSLSVY